MFLALFGGFWGFWGVLEGLFFCPIYLCLTLSFFTFTHSVLIYSTLPRSGRMPGPEAEHTTCLNRRGRFVGGAQKLIIGWPTFLTLFFGGGGGGWGGVGGGSFLPLI